MRKEKSAFQNDFRAAWPFPVDARPEVTQTADLDFPRDELFAIVGRTNDGAEWFAVANSIAKAVEEIEGNSGESIDNFDEVRYFTAKEINVRTKCERKFEVVK